MNSRKSPDKVLTILAELFVTDPSSLALKPLPKRGSQREFFRLTLNDGRTFIVIIYDPERVENTYYANIASFLKDINVPVPSLLFNVEDECLLVIEDLGNVDLYSLRNLQWKKKRLLYENVLSAIIKLHKFPLDEFRDKKIKISKGFDSELYSWEREYFIENFVREVAGVEIEPLFLKELEIEFKKLTSDLMSLPVCLIHRDLQSQNIMVWKDQTYLIDFQGMRPGNPFYDLGSLLFDPYVSFSENERQELVEFYCREHALGFSIEKTLQALYKASIQRLMQALGAFGFLSKKRGLTEFLAYVPQGLKNLYHLLCLDGEMKRLKELVSACGSKHGLKL